MEEIRYIEIVVAFHDCRNSHDAEDVMQTVFLKLYQKNPVTGTPEDPKLETEILIK